jgi:hypothetical protein
MTFKRTTPITALDLDSSDLPDAGPSSKGGVTLGRLNALIGLRPGDVYQLASENPTVTASAASAATSISGGVLRRPKVLTPGGTAVDLDGDPHFRYLAAGPQGSMAYGTTFPDYNHIRPTYLTGGAGQAARWTTHIRFFWVGSAFEVFFKALSTSLAYRLKVNGRRVTENLQTVTGLTSGSQHMLKFDFGSTAPRLIEITFNDTPFGGVYIEPTAQLSRGPKPKGKFLVIGDSISAGAGGVNRHDTWPSRCGELLGCEETLNVAIGGTGFLTTAGSQFRDRMDPDVIAMAPDIMVMFGGFNDGSVNAAGVAAESLYVMSHIQASLPKTLIFMAGSFLCNNSPGANLITVNRLCELERGVTRSCC